MNSNWTRIVLFLIVFLVYTRPEPIPEPTEEEVQWSQIHQRLNIQLKYSSKNPVKVAIVDTGVDPYHEQFQNLKIKDGWDFVLKSKNKTDEHGHGTHVAGIILKVLGEENPVEIYPLNYFNPIGDNLKTSIEALKWALENKMEIINYSGGGNNASAEELEILRKLEQQGTLVVVAAGNDKFSLEEGSYYPCSYNLNNVICVGAVDLNLEKLPSSNWGPMVRVYAMGKDVFSTRPHNSIGVMTGTSQATPFVTATAVLIKQQNPSLKAWEIKEMILSKLTYPKSLEAYSGGILNVDGAVFEAVSHPRIKVTQKNQ